MPAVIRSKGMPRPRPRPRPIFVAVEDEEFDEVDSGVGIGVAEEGEGEVKSDVERVEDEVTLRPAGVADDADRREDDISIVSEADDGDAPALVLMTGPITGCAVIARGCVVTATG